MLLHARAMYFDMAISSTILAQLEEFLCPSLFLLWQREWVR